MQDRRTPKVRFNGGDHFSDEQRNRCIDRAVLLAMQKTREEHLQLTQRLKLEIDVPEYNPGFSHVTVTYFGPIRQSPAGREKLGTYTLDWNGHKIQK